MIEKLQNRQEELYKRLDSLEGCEDNEVYAAEVREIRDELDDISLMLCMEF